MQLSEVHKLICQSTVDDWNVIPCWGANTGASYRDAWDKSNGKDGWELYHASHHQVLACRENVSLTIASGMPEHVHQGPIDGLTPEWNTFPDDRPLKVQWADIFWNNALIDRYAMTAVDGGRALLPWPESLFTRTDGHEDAELTGYEVLAFHAALARLLDSASSRGEFDRYLADAGFRVVERLSRW